MYFEFEEGLQKTHVAHENITTRAFGISLMLNHQKQLSKILNELVSNFMSKYCTKAFQHVIECETRQHLFVGRMVHGNSKIFNVSEVKQLIYVGKFI